jgi:hypothetical protein
MDATFRICYALLGGVAATKKNAHRETMNYDIVGDIHGQAEKLSCLSVPFPVTQ